MSKKQRDERNTLMSVENHLIAFQCFPSVEAKRIKTALREIRVCLKTNAPCPECDGTGWQVVDRVICLVCSNTGRIFDEGMTG